MTTLRPDDIAQLAAHGITKEQAEAQIDRFNTGFPWLEVQKAARAGDGITVLSPADEEKAIERWKKYLADGGEVTKFVPASGAASRMFKALFEFINGSTDTPAKGSDVEQLLEHITELALYPRLSETISRLYGTTVDDMLTQGRNRDIIKAIVNPEGMNY